jgi:NSS family neurotransmitter:Na+ symporter
VPIAAVILLIWWLTISATVYSPDQWFNPLNPFSVMTCLVQWFLVLAIFILANRWTANRMAGIIETDIQE